MKAIITAVMLIISTIGICQDEEMTLTEKYTRKTMERYEMKGSQIRLEDSSKGMFSIEIYNDNKIIISKDDTILFYLTYRKKDIIRIEGEDGFAYIVYDMTLHREAMLVFNSDSSIEYYNGRAYIDGSNTQTNCWKFLAY